MAQSYTRRRDQPGFYEQFDPVLRRQAARRRICEKLIQDAALHLGLDAFWRKEKRGRPLKFPHPLPRRKSTLDERERHLLDSPIHHTEKHQDCYVEGCPSCYRREYAYFQRHPELRPTNTITAGTDDPRAARFRPWVTPNWPKIEARMKAEAQEREEKLAFHRAKELKKKRERARQLTGR